MREYATIINGMRWNMIQEEHRKELLAAADADLSANDEAKEGGEYIIHLPDGLCVSGKIVDNGKGPHVFVYEDERVYDPAKPRFRYLVRDRETGNYEIDWFVSYEEALAQLEEFEEKDRKEGIFEENCYEIYDMIEQEIVYP